MRSLAIRFLFGSLATFGATGLSGSTAMAAGARSDVPLSFTTTPDGTRAFSFPMKVGTTTIQTVLDSGSATTQILPPTLKSGDVTDTGQPESQGYVNGNLFSGTIGTGTVTVSAVSATANVGVVTSVGCKPGYPNCKNKGQSADNVTFYRQCKALAGVRIYPHSGLMNLFQELGVQKFIVTGPRVGESGGDVLLNPTSNDTARFIPLVDAPSYYNGTTVPPVGSVLGCLTDETTGERFCGAIFFDSGVTGITIWPDHSRTVTTFAYNDTARLEFRDGYGGKIAGLDFQVSDSYPGVVKARAATGAVPAVIFVGVLPYVGFRVLSDLDRPGLSVQARSATDKVTPHVP